MIAAFFDLEKTIAAAAVEPIIIWTLVRRGLLPKTDVLKAVYITAKYNLGIIGDYEQMKHSGAKSTRGLCQRDAQDIVAEMFETRLRQIIYPDAVLEIERLRAAGAKIYIVSSSFELAVDPYAAHLKVDGCFCTRFEVQGGLYTGALTGTIYHQENKGKIVRELAAKDGLDLAACHAFGDSFNDRYMLDAVGHPVAVNPDRRLSRIAHDKGWRVARWTLGT